MMSGPYEYHIHIKTKKGGKMKKSLAILFICSLFFIASVGNGQISESLSSSYDGRWEGYANTSEGRYLINMEIKDGIMTGSIEGADIVEVTKIKGRINADNNLFTSPFFFKNNSGRVSRVTGVTKSMSPDRIEGIYTVDAFTYKWFVEKAGIDKPESTTSNFQINEKEPWTGKWKVESISQGSGIWAMEQAGEIVKSTADSAYAFRGKVRGNQLKGILQGASDLPFAMEMPPDAMSIKGALEIWGRSYQLEGNRIE
jgi:hypothetical protein